VFSSAAEVLNLPGIDYLHVRPEVRDHPNNKPSNNCSYPFPSRDVGRKDWAVRSGDSRALSSHSDLADLPRRSLCLCVPTRRRNLTAFVFAADPRFQKGESHVVHAFAGHRVANRCLSLKLRPLRRAHTCLSEGREPVTKALAQCSVRRKSSHTLDRYLPGRHTLNSREPSRFL
jgi:hypothetical protein